MWTMKAADRVRLMRAGVRIVGAVGGRQIEALCC
jgi:hypothetical protein